MENGRNDRPGSYDGGIEVTEGQKHGPHLYDAYEKGWPLYAVRMDDRLAARGSKRARGDGSCESSFRYNSGRCKKPRRSR